MFAGNVNSDLLPPGDAAESDGRVDEDPPPPAAAGRDARAGELIAVEWCEKSPREDVVANALRQQTLENEGRLVTRGQRRAEVRRAHDHAPRARNRGEWGQSFFRV